ncbi:MAG: formylmethanofuran--tetrahydromethanopterin N-formyltransferase [Planctomycetota bacterium]
MNPVTMMNDVEIADTFAEAFGMQATRLIITADSQHWVDAATTSLTGFATSVIACGIEAAVEMQLDPEETPDGRPGASVLAFSMGGKELQKRIPIRCGQCVMTCPTTSLFSGMPASETEANKRIPLGKTLRFFGDGNQISKVVDGTRYWRIPVMDGEFLCEESVGRKKAIGGGNFLIVARDVHAASAAAIAASAAIRPLPDVITPFPGGVVRSGSKVGSKYDGMFASTNDAFCPTLKQVTATQLPDAAGSVMEIVIDGLSDQAIRHAMKIGIHAACQENRDGGLLQISAGNYGGNLGKHHFHLREIV